MSIDEYNEIRRRLGKASLICGLSFITMGLFAAAKLIPLVISALLVILFSGFLATRYVKKLKEFRCPQCGQDPTNWISPNPSDESTHFNQFTSTCLHCNAWLGDVN